MISPLFSSEDEEDKKPQPDEGYVLRHRHGKKIEPLSKGLIPPSPAHRYTVDDDPKPTAASAAVELIRRKVEALYNAEEPAAKAEIAEVKAEAPKARSKHQQFMYELSTSGKSLAQIQTEWHKYYVGLPNHEKHEVWREFYENNNQRQSAYNTYVQQQATIATQHAAAPEHTPQQQFQPPHNFVHEPEPKAVIVTETLPPAMPHNNRRSALHIRKQLVRKVLTASQQEKAKQHFKSLLFGLSTGVIVLIIFLFGFFNEVIIAPFIQPSRHVSATPLILNTDSMAANATPEVIIPKINVEIPTIFADASINEEDIQNSLQDGVVHYPTTVFPGQQGNTAFFGHSSNNIFNKGKYKFAFVLLHEMVPGDTFYLTYNKTVYTYRVFDKRIVDPGDVSVLNPVPGKTATATLITCDPPGTSNHRLVVWGEQISPDPSGATAPTTPQSTQTPTQLPSNGPTLWGRFWHWVTS